ncbi:hypothetical protein KAFR_0D04760 [Kazachstania africana CBS 2517]|uniref:non-specific serine/threonine protein kinase n=1 Tax=Kazachstania africana (strain ATCC 22294 / BCRC 22015 / CBS 2517 / CECT 1963 / NBRC 1671 / NRRL Y-8276) TaxID=1071382 RepID=H2AUS3_KAZAF|nr:hypothetical protein KAFR_0D04760 [Kazachstania africana CBS 2517]CCF58123.1 hypothetical protein KAFR_0D04760 [Kazachstania africana CBS 2517]
MKISSRKFFLLSFFILLFLGDTVSCWSFSRANKESLFGSKRLQSKSILPLEGVLQSDTYSTLDNLYPSLSSSILNVELENAKVEPTRISEQKGSTDVNNQQYGEPLNSLTHPSLSRRSIDKLSLTNILIAADIEGGLHALNRETGKVLWSIDALQFQPLIDIKEPPRERTNEILIVEPYGDGNIYYFNVHQGLQKIPVSISQLIATSPMHLKTDIVIDELGNYIEDEKIYTGSRKTIMYNLNILNGEILSTFGSGAENKNCDNILNNSIDNLKIGKTVYQLGIHSKDGSSYNVTYAAWQQNFLDIHLGAENSISKDGIYIAPFRDKSLLAIDSNFKIAKWVSPDFPGIIIAVYDVFYDTNSKENLIVPHPFHTLDKTSADLHNVYLQQTENRSWAALSNDNFPSLVRAAPISKYASSERWRVSSIFENEDLFKTAVTGVHTLKNVEYEQMVESQPEQVVQGLPYKSALLLEPTANALAVELRDEKMQALERYISPEEIEAYRVKVQEQITKELLQQSQQPFLHQFGNFIYKIVEGGLIFYYLIFLGVLQKIKVMPPLHILLEKAGLFPAEELSIQNVEINEDKLNDQVNISDNVSDDKSSNHEQTSLSKNANNYSILHQDNPEIENMENDHEPHTNEKEKRKRGSRGGKKNKRKQSETTELLEFEHDLKNLVVTDKILGYGSSGTIVFQGTFQGRPVAVKRMLIDFCDVAYREIKLLTESDDHANVIRYYCSETTKKFLYIALELCTATLQDLVELKQPSYGLRELQRESNPINIIQQIALGVAHLHSLKIIHRDLKPQNILVGTTKRYIAGHETDKEILRMLISDFGLCKKLDTDQSSFRTNMNNPAGTTGWRAPELLNESATKILETINEKGDMIVDPASTNSVTSTDSFYDPFTKQRLTRAIDIFSLGCIFFYVLSRGNHPFGDKYIREANIIQGKYDLSALRKSLRDRSLVIEATDLISKMIDNDPRARPAADDVLKHPLFWPTSKKLSFLLKVSDRFEVERRDPPSELLLKLESVSKNVITNADWSSKFDKSFLDNLGKYRKYNMDKLMDLLRALRNKYHHFMDLPEDLSEIMGPIPDGFYDYFSKRFPNLLMEIYHITREVLEDDQMLNEFF